MQEFIRIENVAFYYEKENAALPAVLTGINLRIDKGESIALIGANGSGKSTLAKLFNALLIPQSGIVRVAGMDTREQTNHAAIRASVGMVFQRPQDQIVASTVEEDVAFGPANLGLPSGEVRARVELALASTRLNTYCERSSLLLSAGETQRLALAGVLAMKPECVIFDETTAMLDPQGRDMVLQQVRALNDQGITTILITHLMQEAVHCARVLLLHKGRLLLDGSPTDVFVKNSNLEKFGLTVPDAYTAGVMLKRFFPSIPEGVLEAEFLLKSLPPYNGQMRPPMHGSHEKRKTGQALITIEGLGYSYMAGTPLAHPALEHVDMRIEKGQIHALLGGTGSGKTTLLQHCNGLIRPQSGRVLVDGSDLGDKKLDVKQLRRKVALAFQQPEDQVFEQYVGDEIAFGPRKLGFEGKISDVVKTAMAYVGLDFEQYKDRLVSTLSGGERRKVALASVLAAQPQILLLDEPFSGLDPVSTRNLVVQIRQWKQAGKTICISTHQYEEPAQILDRVSVIHEGKDVLHGSAGAVLGRVNAMTAAGLKAPLAAQIAQVLIEKGWPLEEDNASLQALEKNLEGLLGCKK